MRILIQGLNYAPELVGIGKYTGEMVDFLVRQGHIVTVVTTPPYYPMWQIAEGYSGRRYTTEKAENLTVIRCPLWVPKKVTGKRRIIHLMSYALSALPVMVAQAVRKPDVIVTIAPALTSAPNAILAGWLSGAPTWLHIQDFELDAAMNLGIVGSGGGAAKIASGIERFIFKRFKQVSSISHAMVDKLGVKGVSEERRSFFPNWIDADVIYPMHHSPMRAEMGYTDDEIVILYSGSMGVKQGLEVLIAAARQLSSRPEINFLLCGQGSAKDELVNMAAGLPNVRFLPLQPYEKLNELLNCADIQVLPQRKDASDLMMPSKLLGMMASGKAIIAGCEPGSELFTVVDQVGMAVAPEDTGAFVSAILTLVGNPDRREQAGSKARAFVCHQYACENVLKDFELQLIKLSEIS